MTASAISAFLMFVGFGGMLDVPWEAISHHFPSRWDGQRSGSLILARPDQVHRRGLARRRGHITLPFAYLKVNRALLVDAIVFYATYPEYRAAIGTPQEYERLCRNLAEWQRYFILPQVVNAGPTMAP